jgi:23S rRNA (uracil1939-C5)-methyltransferase
MSEHCTVKIEALNSRGIGLAVVEGRTLEIPFTLPGETVEIDIRRKTKNQKTGFPRAVISPSPDRVLPPCPHFTQCGGCLLQHLSPKAYQDFKQQKVIDALKSYGLEAAVQPALILGPGLRRRIDFQARLWDDEVQMGYHEAESKKPFNVMRCPLVHPDIEALFAPLRALVKPMLEQERLIHFFVTQAENGIDILLAGFKTPLSSTIELSLTEFAKTHKVIRLAYKVKRHEKILYSKAHPTVRFGNHDVAVSAFGFLQATKASDHHFSHFLDTHLPARPLKIADLFCGRGTLSLALTQRGHQVAGFECDGHALSALKDVAEPALTVHERDLFDQPLSTAELNAFDAVVMNPPRAGAEAQAHELATAEIQHLIYISCNPESFARDCRILTDGGFTLEHVLPLDQFMWSGHIEVLSVLRRK